MTASQTPALGFGQMDLSKRLLKALKQQGLLSPTPIQGVAIPQALQGKDLLGIAQTGTGKTLAFGLPLLQTLEKDNSSAALILLPTRELAQQVYQSLASLGRGMGLYTALLIGGVSFHPQLRDLKNKPRLIIATPGRLVDMMERGAAKLNQISLLVLDEADRMLDMGFAPQLKAILTVIPKNRQTMLFSATMPRIIEAMAKAHMKEPVRIEIAPEGSVAEKIEQNLFIIQREAKLELLKKLLKERQGTALIFSRTKHGAKKINRALQRVGYRSAEIHSNRTQSQRQLALAGFKSGAHPILVATDIAARGIDVPNINTVINFDLPDNPADYVHRIGRTGRAGKEGEAISFATPEQRREVKSIERLTQTKLSLAPLPEGMSHSSLKLVLKEKKKHPFKLKKKYRGRRSLKKNRSSSLAMIESRA